MISQQYFFSKILFYNPSIITIFKKQSKLIIKGPLGFLFLILPLNLFIRLNNTIGAIQLLSKNSSKSLSLTYLSLLNQKIYGVTFGFFEILSIKGLGWKLSVKNRIITFSLGFSHVVIYKLTSNVEVVLLDTKKQSFKLFGLDLIIIQQTVADLCFLRPFNVYKGTGIFKQSRLLKLKVSSKTRS